jgi:hypothetical protein
MGGSHACSSEESRQENHRQKGSGQKGEKEVSNATPFRPGAAVPGLFILCREIDPGVQAAVLTR